MSRDYLVDTNEWRVVYGSIELLCGLCQPSRLARIPGAPVPLCEFHRRGRPETLYWPPDPMPGWMPSWRRGIWA